MGYQPGYENEPCGNCGKSSCNGNSCRKEWTSADSRNAYIQEDKMKAEQSQSRVPGVDAAAKFIHDSLVRASQDGSNQTPTEFIAYLLTIPRQPDTVCSACLRWIYRRSGENRWTEIDEILRLAFESIDKLDEQSLSALFGYTGVMKQYLPNRELLRPWNNQQMQAFYGPRWKPNPDNDVAF